VQSIRRVITGIDETGKSVFVADEVVEAKVPPTLGGNQILDLFGSDAIPTVPNDGTVEQGLRFFPTTPEGYRFIIFTYPPESEIVVPEDPAAAWEETERLTPGMGDAVSDSGGMHYTATVDIEYVIAGEFTLTLDDGESRVLKAGDCLVQCGAKHSWANKGDVPATLLLVFVGAHLDESRFGAYAMKH
jgi:mannose-6-phosphate isomerase-like protein (cupin superfamily)